MTKKRWFEIVTRSIHTNAVNRIFIRAESVVANDTMIIIGDDSIAQMLADDTYVEEIIEDSFDVDVCLTPFLYKELLFEPINKDSCKKIVDWSCGHAESTMEMNLHGQHYIVFHHDNIVYSFGLIDDVIRLRATKNEK